MLFAFPDASLVLRAAPAVFLVHRGFLERHSPVLAHAISFTPTTAFFRGLPVLDLQDSPQDLAAFLLALYDGTSHIKYDATDFLNLSAVLRLATKYHVNHLRLEILNGLSLAWPRSLAQWEVREASATSSSGVYEPRKFLPHPIMVINLARAVDALLLLPSAFYDLSRCYPSDTAGGYKCPKTQETHHLSDLDLTNLLKGKEHASQFLSTFIVNELENREPVANCTHGNEPDLLRRRHCQAAFEAITFEILRDVNGVVCHRSSDPLFAIMDAELMQTREEPVGQYGVSMRVCEYCRAGFSAAVDHAREEFWRKLPQWFGLAGRER
ncbi:hypothetical protein APHAL10511_003775 [Amanita phalloides]|nr:hypothetical protein APHAL10511_003775 [Amanita phalloides]